VVKFSKSLVAASLVAFSTLTFGSNETANLQKSLSSAVSSQDYRAASSTAFRLASAHKSQGETRAACAALAQSLEYYRKALTKDSGISEPAIASINDGSDGMADVRAKFGCTRS
jgi:hypothetical protein